jgi:hypothetical protein
MRKGIRHVVGVGSIFLTLCLSVRGADPPRQQQQRPQPQQQRQQQQQDKPKPVPAITVTQTDGTVVRGQITSSDPDQIIMQPARKPGEKEDPAPVTIAWKQIKTVSNGLSHQKALDEWKLQHHDQLCPVCHGNRAVLCSVCKGTKHDPASAADCKTCKGELLVDCKQPKCKGGQIPCPNTCLKAYEGTWVEREGKKWRFFHSAKGDHGWSEAHLGELIVLDRKTGEYQNQGKCPTCGGTTYVECPTCHGLGKMPCPTCVARTDAAACPAHCDDGTTVCTVCSGTGLKGDNANPPPGQ